MPYPALPPEIPQLISVSPVEADHCSSLSDQDGFRKDFINAGGVPGSVRPATPEKFPQKPLSLVLEPPHANSATTTSIVDRLSSCAQLLGNTAATGYLPQTNPSSDRPARITSPSIRQVRSDVSPPEVLGRSPERPRPLPARSLSASSLAASPIKVAQAINPSPQSYSISGVAGRLAATPEPSLMAKLNQAVMFDALVESYSALSSLTAADLKQLARNKTTRLAQVPFGLPPASPSLDGNLFPSGSPFPSPIAPLDIPATPNPPAAPTPSPGSTNPPPIPGTVSPSNVIEVSADRQEYDERRQVFTAEGNVTMRFRGSLLDADRVQVNLTNRLAVAEGNVALTRGRQVLRGRRFEYNFVQGVGTVQKARGEIFLPTSGVDTALSGTTDQTGGNILARPLSDRIAAQQPLQNVVTKGGISTSVGAGRDVGRVQGALPKGGELRRLRFEAEQVDFTPEGWVAQKIQITNDPFSPPELVLKADKATLTRLSPLQDEIRAERPRLVLDQKVSIPILPSRLLIDRSPRQPGLIRFGIDGEDRGGLFVEGNLRVIESGKVNFSIFPQIFLQRMVSGSGSTGIGDPNNYGIRSTLDVALSPTTFLRGRAALTTVDPNNFSDKLRASVRLQQIINTGIGPHTLAVEYTYRDRLFNGSLGFQTVQSSLGAIFFSPNITLGKSGLVLNYQVGYQEVTADTDRANLLNPVRANNQVTLGRFQATASLGRSFTLWQGKTLPATPTQGLRYTATPVLPYISVNANVRGVFSSYTSGDVQQDLIGSVGIYGQFGHFSRDFFDYTAIGVSYSQVVGSGQSPFLFDRSVDNRVVSLSFFQQVFGPIRVGAQTSFNVDTQGAISTDYFLEYTRRTHGIIIRYNPVLAIGSIGFRISDFNWTGTGEAFEGADVTPVEGGVIRR